MTVAAHIGPADPRSGKWSPEEDAVLRASYQNLGAARTGEILGRSYFTVCCRARRIGLKSKPRWSPVDDRRLSMLWGAASMRAIARVLGRSQGACADRGRKLGLKAGVQRGMGRIKQQANRTGFHAKTLRRILAWARVPAEPVTSFNAPGRAPRPDAYCNTDVDAAIAKWMSSEYVGAAARRSGMHDARPLLRALTSGRFEVPKRPKDGSLWRVPSEIIDAAVAFLQSTESIAEAARRHRLVPGVLIHWLRSGGATTSTRFETRVERVVIDRIVEARREVT